MCRIVGFRDFTYRGDYDLQQTIVAMRDTLREGGPDDAGHWVDVEHGLALGHRRLAILDLSSRGHQPMTDGGGRWIVHNGEVYNFQALRRPLAHEAPFESDTDTEVVLRGFAARGPAVVDELRGMFAFAVWDEKQARLTLVRDRMGIKPLFYYHADGLFIFASDVKAFHEHPRFRARIDPDALRAYLRYGYVNGPRSIFMDARKLEPGCYLELGVNQAPRVHRYWDVTQHTGNDALAAISEDEACEELERRLQESATLRTISDVPVGVFLSGGVDSSLVTALVQRESSRRFKTFTIAFEAAEHDEAPFARQVAERLGTDHTELLCRRNDAAGVMQELPHAFGEPFGDPSAIPTLLVSRLARQHVTVVLCGDGGDELFFGYNHLARNLRQLRATRSLDRLGLSAIAGAALRPLDPGPGTRAWLGNSYWRYEKLRAWLDAGRPSERLAALRSHQSDAELARLLPAFAPAGDDFVLSTWDRIDTRDPGSFLMLGDLLTYLPEDILTKVDRASMWVALEGREPLIDHVVAEFAVGLPWRLHYRGNVKKRLLKRVLARHLPHELVDRPKHGFSVPVESWFRGELSAMMDSYLNRSRLVREGLFDPDAVGELRRAHAAGALYDFSKLWFILAFQMWREAYLP